MKRVVKYITAVMMICCLTGLLGCKKFLEEKSSKSLAVPSTLKDLQALLDNANWMNLCTPAGAEVSADDYNLTDAKWTALSNEEDRRMYTWEKDRLFLQTGSNNWMNLFSSIYYCNTVLSVVESIPITSSNELDWKNVKGEALFSRANDFLDGVNVWCLAYDQATAKTDPGLPLRLNTDFNETSVRSNLQQTYERILTDLKGAVGLLPVVPLSKLRPCKAAAYGLLARTYLSMRNYQQAGLYADSSLALNNTLVDFNTLTLTAAYPFSLTNNTELVYVRYFASSPLMSSASLPVVLPSNYNSFADNDLRKQAFFTKNTDGTDRFKGSYLGSDGPFSGIATNEIYLIKAECLARESKVKESTDLLNALISKRWNKNKTYTPFVAATASEALTIVLTERRKELMMRGLRWMDIKRLNKEGANISLTRTVNGKVYTLPANDLRFALPIPEDVIALSGMEQNPR